MTCVIFVGIMIRERIAYVQLDGEYNAMAEVLGYYIKKYGEVTQENFLRFHEKGMIE